MPKAEHDAVPNHAQRDEEELGRFFELSLDMLCIASFDGHFKRLNGVWEQVTGFSIEELISRPFLISFTRTTTSARWMRWRSSKSKDERCCPSRTAISARMVATGGSTGLRSPTTNGS